ncbi:hypothetical protein TWF718_009123 [Orbilia javanica]|uniref:Uncharacterized protein n=1 Tax=Orbilia javanica TaxID=47235 RepID=A0AAN8MZ66_9PEZI
MLYLSRTADGATRTRRDFVPISEPCVNEAEPSEWVLQRSFNGFLNIRNPLANATWNLESQAAYCFNRIEPDARLFESRSSDKVASGIYKITNVAIGSRLGFGTARSLGTLATSKPASDFTWHILPSTTGFYSISQNDAYLSVSTKAIDPRDSQPCVGVKGLDLALWKLIITQEGFYKIVNKETGLAVAPHEDEGNDGLVQTKDDSASIKDTIWKIEMKEALEDPKDASFELIIPDGPYFLQNVSSNLVLGSQGSGNEISIADQDNSRDGITSKFQAFSVRKNRDGWYRISSYTQGTYLSLQKPSGQPRLTLKSSSMATEDDTLDWRFVQQASTPNVTLVNQSAPELGFEVSNRQLNISDFSASNKAMLWNISPAMGTTKDTKFTPGVYLISAYLTREEVTARLATAADGNSGENPTTEQPLALEGRESDTTFLNPLAPQNLMQLWTLKQVNSMLTDNVYDIESFQGSGAIKVDGAANHRWRFIAQNTGGFKIRTFSLVDGPGRDDETYELLLARSNKKICLVKESEVGDKEVLWQIGRTGFYLQNQAVTLFNKVLATDKDGIAQMANYELPWLISPSEMSKRIWHLIYNRGETYSLINEATRCPLHPQNGRMTARSVQHGTPAEFQKWNLVKFEEGIAFHFKGVTTVGLLLGVTGERGGGVILRPGPDEVSRRAETNEPYDVPKTWKTWSMIPVAMVEGKPYMSLPRYLVATKSEGPSHWTHTWQEDPRSGSAQLSAYESDNSWQRFRMQTLGGYSLLIDEASGNLLPNNGGAMVNPSSTGRHDVWFKVTADSTLVRADGWLSGNAATEKSRLVSHPGDFFKFGNDFRIQIRLGPGETYVLSVDANSRLTVAELDMSDNNQLWNNWDMGLGRRIFHSRTGKLLERNDSDTVILRDWNPNDKNTTFWELSAEANNTQSTNGYHLLKIFNSSDGRSIRASPSDQPIRLDGNHPTPIRIIRRSGWVALSRRLLVLQRFLELKAPILVHAKGVKTPYSVEEHFSHHSLYKLDGTLVYSNLGPDSLPIENDGYKLLLRDPNADITGESPKTYVSICQATDPIHLNYTDFNLFILYPPEFLQTSRKTYGGGGWKRLTLRINNETNLLESVYFPAPGPGWVFNLDMNFAATKDPNGNPLKIYRIPDTNIIKLHIFVDSEGNLTPYFPKDTSMVDVLDKSKWGAYCDIGANAEIIKAPFVDDDGTGAVPKMPPWTAYRGQWTREPDSRCTEVGFWNASTSAD